MSAPPKPRPCASCPYRKDVPRGVWDRSEYEKLPLYDEPTLNQPPAAFACHQQDGHLCAGWVGCHDMEENFALRIAVLNGWMTPEQYEETLAYETKVALWSSGQEAHDHGIKDMEDPPEKARQIAAHLVRKGLAQWEHECSKSAPDGTSTT